MDNVPRPVVDGLVHQCFGEVLPWVHAGVPVFLTGGAGVGKTTLAETIAKSLGARKILVLQADASAIRTRFCLSRKPAIARRPAGRGFRRPSRI